MEHIIQFAVGIDDNAIRESVAKNAEKQIIQNIQQQVRNSLFESTYYGRGADEKSGLNNYSKGIVEDFLEKHKDEILEKVAVHLADKLARSKAGKALLEGKRTMDELKPCPNCGAKMDGGNKA